jgi:16S rRNA (uracil1498-N3)-methyltransferase
MSRRRFYAPPSAFHSGGSFVDLSSDEARHLRDVLRLAPEDAAFVFDGAGREYECAVNEIRRDSARLKVISEVSPARPESTLRLTLALALLKGEKFDLVVQKSTELGVTAILPVMTKLADVRLRDHSDANRRVARWQRIALEAAKQSGRAFVPRVSVPSEFSALLRRIEHDACLMFSERLGQSLDEAIKGVAGISSITALVGSEGGWADEELSRAVDLGWKIVTLGGRTLRAETAAIAVTILLQHHLGDLR